MMSGRKSEGKSLNLISQPAVNVQPINVNLNNSQISSSQISSVTGAMPVHLKSNRKFVTNIQQIRDNANKVVQNSNKADTVQQKQDKNYTKNQMSSIESMEKRKQQFHAGQAIMAEKEFQLLNNRIYIQHNANKVKQRRLSYAVDNSYRDQQTLKYQQNNNDMVKSAAVTQAIQDSAQKKNGNLPSQKQTMHKRSAASDRNTNTYNSNTNHQNYNNTAYDTSTNKISKFFATSPIIKPDMVFHGQQEEKVSSINRMVFQSYDRLQNNQNNVANKGGSNVTRANNTVIGNSQAQNLNKNVAVNKKGGGNFESQFSSDFNYQMAQNQMNNLENINISGSITANAEKNLQNTTNEQSRDPQGNAAISSNTSVAANAERVMIIKKRGNSNILAALNDQNFVSNSEINNIGGPYKNTSPDQSRMNNGLLGVQQKSKLSKTPSNEKSHRSVEPKTNIANFTIAIGGQTNLDSKQDEQINKKQMKLDFTPSSPQVLEMHRQSSKNQVQNSQVESQYKVPEPVDITISSKKNTMVDTDIQKLAINKNKLIYSSTTTINNKNENNFDIDQKIKSIKRQNSQIGNPDFDSLEFQIEGQDHQNQQEVKLSDRHIYKTAINHPNPEYLMSRDSQVIESQEQSIHQNPIVTFEQESTHNISSSHYGDTLLNKLIDQEVTRLSQLQQFTFNVKNLASKSTQNTSKFYHQGGSNNRTWYHNVPSQQQHQHWQSHSANKGTGNIVNIQKVTNQARQTYGSYSKNIKNLPNYESSVRNFQKIIRKQNLQYQHMLNQTANKYQTSPNKKNRTGQKDTATGRSQTTMNLANTQRQGVNVPQNLAADQTLTKAEINNSVDLRNQKPLEKQQKSMNQNQPQQKNLKAPHGQPQHSQQQQQQAHTHNHLHEHHHYHIDLNIQQVNNILINYGIIPQSESRNQEHAAKATGMQYGSGTGNRSAANSQGATGSKSQHANHQQLIPRRQATANIAVNSVVRTVKSQQRNYRSNNNINNYQQNGAQIGPPKMTSGQDAALVYGQAVSRMIQSPVNQSSTKLKITDLVQQHKKPRASYQMINSQSRLHYSHNNKFKQNHHSNSNGGKHLTLSKNKLMSPELLLYSQTDIISPKSTSSKGQSEADPEHTVSNPEQDQAAKGATLSQQEQAYKAFTSPSQDLSLIALNNKANRRESQKNPIYANSGSKMDSLSNQGTGSNNVVNRKQTKRGHLFSEDLQSSVVKTATNLNPSIKKDSIEYKDIDEKYDIIIVKRKSNQAVASNTWNPQESQDGTQADKNTHHKNQNVNSTAESLPLQQQDFIIYTQGDDLIRETINEETQVSNPNQNNLQNIDKVTCKTENQSTTKQNRQSTEEEMEGRAADQQTKITNREIGQKKPSIERSKEYSVTAGRVTTTRGAIEQSKQQKPLQIGQSAIKKRRESAYNPQDMYKRSLKNSMNYSSTKQMDDDKNNKNSSYKNNSSFIETSVNKDLQSSVQKINKQQSEPYSAGLPPYHLESRKLPSYQHSLHSKNSRVESHRRIYKNHNDYKPYFLDIKLRRTQERMKEEESVRQSANLQKISSVNSENFPTFSQGTNSKQRPVEESNACYSGISFKDTNPCHDIIGPKPTINDFEIKEQIGLGNFGRVWKAYNRKSDRITALKIIKKDSISAMKQVDHLINEREVLRYLTLTQLNNQNSAIYINQNGSTQNLQRFNKNGNFDIGSCPFTVKIFSSFQDQENLYLELEYVEGCTLLSQIKKMNKDVISNMQFYACEALQTLEYLHQNDIIFRDLKPENIVLSMRERGHIKLVDFGFAKQLKGPNKRSQTNCGTPQYLAPEIIRGAGHSYEVDIWSLGVLMCEIISGQTPFQAENPKATYEKISLCKPTYNRKINQTLRDLLGKIFQSDPEMRITMHQIKNHAVFKDIDWNMSMQDKFESTAAPYIPESAVFNEYATRTSSMENGGKLGKLLGIATGLQKEDSEKRLSFNDEHFAKFLKQDKKDRLGKQEEDLSPKRKRQNPLGDFKFTKINEYF